MPTSPFSPFTFGPLTIKNRFIKTATNEGMARNGGVPSKMLARFHERIAAGGIGMTTVAYCAVSTDGKTFIDQVELNQESVPHLRALTDAVHKHGAAASAQITHGGCFTFLPEVSTGRPLSASGGFNKVGVLSGRWLRRGMDRDDMDMIAGQFVAGAKLAREAGFDAVEIHMGHGYLLSQFVSPLYNKRRDEYGRTPEGRAKYPAEVLARVLEAVGKEMAVVVKFSTTDGHPAGNTAEDTARVAKVLEREGAHLMVLSAGMNVESVSTMFGSPLPAASRGTPVNPIVALGMLIQRLTEQKGITFREMYLREHSKVIRAAVKTPLAYLGGVKTLANAEALMDDGFDLLALGRVLIYDPNFVNNLQSGSVTESGCTACNQCVTMMYSPGGTSCVLKEPGDPVAILQPAAA